MPSKLAAILILLCQSISAVGQSTGLTEIDCWFENTSLTATSCYHHHVYENPDDNSSKLIRMSVVIFKSNSKDKKQDPVLHLQGGPGQAYISNEDINWTYRTNVLKHWLKDRDVIFTEYRGLGISTPSLICNDIDRDVLLAKSDEDSLKVYKKCHNEIASTGVDLTQYHAVNIVKDLVELRKQLNITEWNLWGHSYGSMIAMLLADRDNKYVRSIVAEGVMPPRYRANILSSAEPFVKLLDHLFDACESIFYCSNSHPNPAQAFSSLLEKLEKQPVPISVNIFNTDHIINVDNVWFLEIIFNSLYWKRSKTHVPYQVGKMLAGEHERFEQEFTDYYKGSSLPSFSYGAYLTYTCNETSLLTKQELDHHNLPIWLKKWYQTPDYCEIWKGKNNKSVMDNISASFDTPILFISGLLDPVTPAVWTEEILDDFENGQRFVFSDASHSLIDPETDFCNLIIKNDFINSPMARIDQDRCERDNLKFPEDWNIPEYPDAPYN